MEGVIVMSISWRKKLFITFRMLLMGDGYKKAEFLKENIEFGAFGNKVYWFTRNLPSEPNLVFLHNNIKIASNVYFCTHDIIDLMINDDNSLKLLYSKNKMGGVC